MARKDLKSSLSLLTFRTGGEKMYKLCNFSNYSGDLERINSDPKRLEEFLLEHRLDGIELTLCEPWNGKFIPSQLIKGLHLRNWSIWLDFWQGNMDKVLDYFGSEEKIKEHFGSLDKEILVENYRQQIIEAERMGVEYVVFHVCHTEYRHVLDRNYAFTDEEVIKATIELLNQVFNGLESKVTLLLENLWMRGLTFLNPSLAEKLLAEVNYPHKGFMLDTGHLMNTNLALSSEEEGISFILQVLKDLGGIKEYIKGVHLQKSISAPYSLKHRNKEVKKEELMNHIFSIDQHQPFDNSQVRRIVEIIEPDYLVYEFITQSKEEWSESISRQNQALNL